MSAMRERVQPILAIVRRDLRQIHRHGLATLVLLTVILFFLGIVGFGIAGGTLRQIGVPPWTGGIGGGGEPLRVNAEANVTSGLAPLSVGFTANTSGGMEPFNIAWTFDDGNGSSEAAPNHTYVNPGRYDVLLAVQSAGGDEPVRSTLRIIAFAPGGPLQVGIGANRTAGRDPLAVSFTATVVGGNGSYTYVWNFSDGQTSALANPSHIFGPTGDVWRVTLSVRDNDLNESRSNELHVSVETVGGESLPINLLDFVYGYMVLVTMVLIPVAFSSNYGGEIKKGTVRALTLYPVGVLEVTVAKLLYAAIAGFIFSFPISVLPALGLGKPSADILGIYATAYLFSFGIVAVAAFTANAFCYATKRMYIKPPLMAYLFVLYSFFLSFTIFRVLMGALAGGGAAGLVQGSAPLIALSPYHQGGLLLSQALGGPGSPDWAVFAIPILLIILGLWLSKRLWPDIYEKE